MGDAAAQLTVALPPNLLGLSAAAAARWLALARLHELSITRPRLDDPGDGEALHDFRVALRRLRSVLRAHRAVLDDSVSRKARRRLARIADASSASRDAEVRLLWLKAQQEPLADTERAGSAWIEEQLAHDRRMSDRALRRALDRHFADVVARLHRQLSHYGLHYTLGDSREPLPARESFSTALHELADALRDRLDAPDTIDDVRPIHRARIAAKRLRYALEPLADGGFASAVVARSATTSIATLKELQDELGAVHDAHVSSHWLADRAAESAARWARREAMPMGGARTEASPDECSDVAVQSAIRALQRRLLVQAERSYSAVESLPAKRRMARVLRSVHAAADRLAATRGG